MLEVATPHLAAGIGEAQVQVHPIRADRALQGDDLQLASQNRGCAFARAGKGGLGEVAHHTQHKAAGVVLKGQLLQAAAHITAGFEVQRHGTHGSHR